MTFYRDIFKRSWEITREHKVLWLFGLFTLFWGGKGMDIEQFFTNARLLHNPTSPFNPAFWNMERWQTTMNAIFPSQEMLVAAVPMMIVVGLAVLAIIVIAQIGLVDGFAGYSRLKKSERYSLAHATQASQRCFVRAVVVSVLGKALSYGVLAVASVPLFLEVSVWQQFTSSFILYVVLTPVGIIISMLTKYALGFIVLENTTLGTSLSRAWALFRANVGVSLEMALLMFVGFFMVNVVAFIAAYLISIPLFVVSGMVTTLFGSGTGVGVYSVVLSWLMVITVTLSAVVFSTWHYGNWTLLFLELTKGPKRSKIHRVWKT